MTIFLGMTFIIWTTTTIYLFRYNQTKEKELFKEYMSITTGEEMNKWHDKIVKLIKD